MPLSTFNDFSTTAASNVDINGIAIQGTSAVQNFDNGLRELMAILRRDVPGLTLANSFTKTQKWAKGADVASASTLTLGDDGNYFDITGTTTITAIAAKGVGTVVKLHFDASLTLTNHATDLVLPGGANIVTAAGDEAELVEYAAGDWRCVSYVKASGKPVIASSVVQYVYDEYVDNANLTTAIPSDDTIPQVTEGTEVLSVTITPTSASNKILIRGQLTGTCDSSGSALTVAVFVNGGANAIFADFNIITTTNHTEKIAFEFEHSPASVSAQTYSVRVGPSSGTARLNGIATARRLGGSMKSTLIAEERTA